ncbi:MAG: hypothetical protein U1C33_00845, partial [Candidatus Cloacimonadaceae bacterium]|nr:hypothetical protein [Candidatus Cloacimonadaceae bacterium]
MNTKLKITQPIRMILFFTIMIAICPLWAFNVINENIQNWTASSSYGNYVQYIPAGNVLMLRCLVSPNAQPTGTASAGRIQCEASNGSVEFPPLVSVGQVEFTLAAGSTGRSIRLQRLVDGFWTDVVTFTGITNTGATYYHALNINEPTVLRLANPSHAIYIHDITITEYEDTVLPIVVAYSPTEITYQSARLSGIVDAAGASPIIQKDFCNRFKDDTILERCRRIVRDLSN